MDHEIDEVRETVEKKTDCTIDSLTFTKSCESPTHDAIKLIWNHFDIFVQTQYQSLPIFQDFLHEEDSIIKALGTSRKCAINDFNACLVTNWLGSPFDIVRPLTDPDWELLRPVLRWVILTFSWDRSKLFRARFRFLVKKSHGGFEDILLRAQKNDQSHYMVNKGNLSRHESRTQRAF